MVSLYSENINKKKAYEQLLITFIKVVHTLKSLKMIPYDSALIGDKIREEHFRNQRKWKYTKTFILYGTEDDIRNTFLFLKPFRLKI